MTRKGPWVQIMMPDGQEKIASPDYINELLGNKDFLANIYRRLAVVESRVDTLEHPVYKEKLKRLLSETPHNLVWLQNRLGKGYYETHRLLFELVAEDKVTVSHSGTHEMFALKEAER